MDKKFSLNQRDAIVKNVVSPIAEGLTLGSLGTVKDWLEENTEEVNPHERSKSEWEAIEARNKPQPFIKAEQDTCPLCKKPASEHSRKENVYTCP